MRLSALNPDLVRFRLRQIIVEDKHVLLLIVPTRPTAQGPLCQHRSARVPSQDERTLVDRPVGERPVRLRWRVRRFRCTNRACPRQIFAERFARLTSADARRTLAQRRALEDDGFAAGGAGGAGLARRRHVVGKGSGSAAIPTARPASSRPPSGTAQAQELRRSARCERYEKREGGRALPARLFGPCHRAGRRS